MSEHHTSLTSSLLFYPYSYGSITYFLWHCPCCAQEDLLSHSLIWPTNVFTMCLQTFSNLTCLHHDHSFLSSIFSTEEIKQNYNFTLFLLQILLCLFSSRLCPCRENRAFAKINPIELDSFRRPGSILPVSCPFAIHTPKSVHARTHSLGRNSLKTFL